MNLNELLPSRFLRQADCPITGEISRVEKANVSSPGEVPVMKPALFLADVEKPLILNTTNLQALAKGTGSEETEDWIGWTVELVVDPFISYGGKIVGGIRVRVLQAAVPQVAKKGRPKTPRGAAEVTE
jgi:hypothetical protein